MNSDNFAINGQTAPNSQTNTSPTQHELSPNSSKTSPLNSRIIPDTSHFNNASHTLQCVRTLTKVCIFFGVISLIGTLYIIIGPATYPRDYPRQELALIFSLSFTIYDFIKAFGTASCVATLIAIFIAKSRYNIQIKKLLAAVICSVLMIYLLSILNGITLYTHFPEYGEYPFFCNFSHF